MKDINFALVETTRPKIYTAMKYWGKKPHNIWGEYIKTYTPENGVFLDPFAGSAISAFEAVRAKRKCIAFDLNPITTFIIEVFCTKFEEDKFKNEVEAIEKKVKEDKVYKNFYLTKCRKCKHNSAVIQNFKWEGNSIYEVGIECDICNDRFLEKPNAEEIRNLKEIEKIDIDLWYPKDRFHRSPSFSQNFKECIGGEHFYNLWTRRNLYTMSKIFDYILAVEDLILRRQLVFAFIQMSHLCSKMSVPRRDEANRGFSTSWGRSAYICANRKMEQNPLLVFLSSSFGRQSVTSSLNEVKKYLGKIPKIVYVDYSNKGKSNNSFDIKYGIVDIAKIHDFIDEKKIDFILTDPPYGGLVQYLDLSSIWLIWLKKFDARFTPNYNSEIIIKGNLIGFDQYKRRFENAVKNLNLVLKDTGKVIFTFHNKKLNIWNTFLHSIRVGGFKIEHVIHQQNRRTGEASVANPYGTSATDFYLRCVKQENFDLNTNEEEFELYLVQTAIKLIALRNEPTPYQILFNGILAELSSAGFDIDNFDKEIQDILSKNIGDIFILRKNNTNKAGDYWWFKNPAKHIEYPDRELGDRVEDTISKLLRRKISIKFDDVLAEIFLKYQNGLTPDVREIQIILEKYANKEGGWWVWKGALVEEDFTKHTEILYLLSEIGKKINKEIYIGKREQPEKYKEKKLSDVVDITDLKSFKFDKEARDRIEMIDMLWINNQDVEYALEVENSTSFTSGIQRASNLGEDIKKIMVLPDKRKKEFLNIKDPLFIEAFKKYNWRYMFYSDLLKLSDYKKITPTEIDKFLNELQ